MVIKKHLIAISFLAICLCLANSAAANEFVDNKDGTVTDTTIGITWQAKDDNVQRDWKEAEEYCRNLQFANHDDWRLPNFYELGTLKEEGESYPLIDTKLFPATKTERYWTATELPYYNNMAFFIEFDKDAIGTDKAKRTQAMQMDNKYYVRCIRGKRKKASSK